MYRQMYPDARKEPLEPADGDGGDVNEPPEGVDVDFGIEDGEFGPRIFSKTFGIN